MNTYDQTFATPEENLACDEVLLDELEEGRGPEILRFWESPEYFVVLGYSNKAATETNWCPPAPIPVLRRCSGGGTVLQGPGCLNYSLILRIPESGPLIGLTSATYYILERNARALQTLVPEPIRVQGTSDLTLGDLKFSGNAQRRKKHALLFHGTFLYNFDLSQIEKYLNMPSKQPDYRKNRSHKNFLTQLPLSRSSIQTALQKEWQAHSVFQKDLSISIQMLIEKQYGKKSWNAKF